MRENTQSGTLTETTLLVLLSVFEKRAGHAIGENIETITNGRVILGAGTLYGAINNLLKKEWISEENHYGKKVYFITCEGKEKVLNEKERMNEVLLIIKNTFSE